MNGENLTQESERRQATVVFADISGFTAMSEKVDPEETTAIINRCFVRLERIVRDHGGHVDKYIGDAIMALFGVPKAIEHAPKQAVNAAIEMRHAVVLLNGEARLPVRLGVHIGINTGLVVAGHVGGAVKRDFTVVGDAVNLASRLTGAAPTGSIYVGADTYRYTQHEFEYRHLGRLNVKGKELPVTAYELRSEKERIHRAKPMAADRHVASALVGREWEFRLLQVCLARNGRGEGGIINLIGEAGLGKSRLLAEACACEEAAALTVLEGRSLSLGQGLSFHPFIDLLRQWAGIVDDDDEPSGQAKLEAAVGVLFDAEGGEIFPFVATLMGMRLTGAHATRMEGIAGESLDKLIVKTMRQLLERLAARRPLVLIFEDLHWADLSSIHLLEPLLTLASESPILFIGAFRPDHPDTSQRILNACREHHGPSHIEVTLEPLAERHCQDLIRNLLKATTLPYSTTATISRAAEGNPFYIEEVVRSLIDEGVVEHGKGGRLTITEKIEGVVIPDTIQGVIMARVDRLPPSTRHVLQVAAVLGRSFYHRLLAHLMPAETDLDAELAQLKERQLLFERKTRRTSTVARSMLAEEVEYVFKHALTQETIYESILQKTRRELHRQAAEVIESLFASRLADFYAMLAFHYSRAEQLEKAEEYLFRAGDEAARAAASSEALRYFREASRLYFLIHGEGGDPRKKALLERNIALALFHTGNLTESVDHFDKALALVGHPSRTGRLAVSAGFVGDMIGLLWWLYGPIRFRPPRPPTEAERDAHAMRYRRGLAQMTSDPQRYFVDSIRMLRRLSVLDPIGIEHAAGTYAAGGALFAYSGISLAISKRFLAVARDIVTDADLRDTFLYRAMQFVYDYHAGNWGNDRVIEEEMVDKALRYGQVWDTFVYRGLDSERRTHRGDFAGAAWQIERLKELSNVYGFFVARSNEYAMSAVLFVEQRRLGRAREMIDLYYATQHEQVFHLFALGTRAKIQVLTGDRGGAAETLAQAAGLLKRMGRATVYHASVFLTARLLHDVEALEASLDGGRRPVSRALTVAARRSARAAVGIAAKVARERVEVYRLSGTLEWVVGHHDRALAWWRRSIVAGRMLDARPELARTYAEVGLRLSASGASRDALDGMTANEYLEMARAQCDALELAWDRARLERANDLRAAG